MFWSTTSDNDSACWWNIVTSIFFPDSPPRDEHNLLDIQHELLMIFASFALQYEKKKIFMRMEWTHDIRRQRGLCNVANVLHRIQNDDETINLLYVYLCYLHFFWEFVDIIKLRIIDTPKTHETFYANPTQWYVTYPLWLLSTMLYNYLWFVLRMW